MTALNDCSQRLLVVLGLVGWLVGWRGDWVLVYGGHSGCFGLGMELLGLMTLASQGIPLLVLGFALWALS